MIYRGYSVCENNNSIEVGPIKAFDLEKTMECGQCFRAYKDDNSCYIIVAMGKVIKVEQQGERLLIHNTNLSDFKSIWFDYFDLQTDYQAINERLSEAYKFKEILEFSSGLRLLRQEFSETLISFILSTRCNISLLEKMIYNICHDFGSSTIYEGKEYFLFPDIACLSELQEEQLKNCKVGFRANYIIRTSSIIKDNKDHFASLYSMDRSAAREKLLNLHGVGIKVADCTLLHSGMNRTVFPVDIWIKRIMQEVYGCDAMKNKETYEFVDTHFGDLCGIAELYLFNYSHLNKIGTVKMNNELEQCI